MAVYVTRKCPNCKYTFEWMERSHISFGDPRVECPKCGTTVIFTNVKEWELRNIFDKSNILFKEYIFMSFGYTFGIALLIFFGMALIPVLWGGNYNETFSEKYEIIMWAVIISITLTAVIMKRHRFISSEIKASKIRMMNKKYREEMHSLVKSRSHEKIKPKVRKLTHSALKVKDVDIDRAIELLLKALSEDSKCSQTYFNLACLYSIKRNKTNSFKYLKIAAELYYPRMNKILTDEDFKWLRMEPEFNSFIKNGFKLELSS